VEQDMKLIDVGTVAKIISQLGLTCFNQQLLERLEGDFSRWQSFQKTPRHVTTCPEGVIELMPCANDEFYTFKYVNGHPANTREGKLSVVAMGVLADIRYGYPLMVCEMTLLTALRTAAVAALCVKYLARKDSRHLALIGTGAQAEFLAHALLVQRPIQQISYFDVDPAAMDKFARNMEPLGLELLRAGSVAEAVCSADVIVTATASRQQVALFDFEQLKPGVHIHAMGGDCSGKTEFALPLLQRSKLVVEYTPQTQDEGEIQQGDSSLVYAELWQLITGEKPGRL